MDQSHGSVIEAFVTQEISMAAANLGVFANIEIFS